MHSLQDDPLRAGFPHSEIPGSGLASSSPGLIAGSHVFHRLSTPRHPPCALGGLITPTTRRRTPARRTPRSRRTPDARPSADTQPTRPPPNDYVARHAVGTARRKFSGSHSVHARNTDPAGGKTEIPAAVSGAAIDHVCTCQRARRKTRRPPSLNSGEPASVPGPQRLSSGSDAPFRVLDKLSTARPHPAETGPGASAGCPARHRPRPDAPPGRGPAPGARPPARRPARPRAPTGPPRRSAPDADADR